jgi:hypothetical protein
MFSNLSLDSCIGNKGEKERWRKVALHPWNLSQESRGSLCIYFAFLAFGGCGLLYKIGLTGFGRTGLTGFGNRPDRFVPSLALVQGEHAYVQGELLFTLVVWALCLSMVLSQMCRAVALA